MQAIEEGFKEIAINKVDRGKCCLSPCVLALALALAGSALLWAAG